ncbi:MAG: hypothetical protein GY799_32595 [Desulfobulbaceae bacterium]|nr:hypothetical protein [Desulfobulbaceae bacterium]
MPNEDFNNWFHELAKKHPRDITPMERVFALEAWNYQQGIIKKLAALLEELNIGGKK